MTKMQLKSTENQDVNWESKNNLSPRRTEHCSRRSKSFSFDSLSKLEADSETQYKSEFDQAQKKKQDARLFETFLSVKSQQKIGGKRLRTGRLDGGLRKRRKLGKSSGTKDYLGQLLQAYDVAAVFGAQCDSVESVMHKGKFKLTFICRRKHTFLVPLRQIGVCQKALVDMFQNKNVEEQKIKDMMEDLEWCDECGKKEDQAREIAKLFVQRCETIDKQ